MFGLSGIELFLIIVFAFLIIGPEKLPGIAKTIGKAIAKFRDTQQEMSEIVKTDIIDPKGEQPLKDPSAALDKFDALARSKKEEVKQLVKEGEEALKKPSSVSSVEQKSTDDEVSESNAVEDGAKSNEVPVDSEIVANETGKSDEASLLKDKGVDDSSAVDFGQSVEETTPEAAESFSERKARYMKERAEKIERGDV